ncbi:unnamed protein product, partial [Ceratitis capitata]
MSLPMLVLLLHPCRRNNSGLCNKRKAKIIQQPKPQEYVAMETTNLKIHLYDNRCTSVPYGAPLICVGYGSAGEQLGHQSVKVRMDGINQHVS